MVQKVEALVKLSEKHAEVSGSKYSITVENVAQIEKKLCTRVTLLVLELKVEGDSIARLKEGHIDERIRGREAVVERQKAVDALENQLRDKEGTLRQVRARLMFVISETETLRHRREKAEKKLSIAQTGESLRTTLKEEDREQLDAKVAELKEVQSRQEMRVDELITMHDAQTKVASELE